MSVLESVCFHSIGEEHVSVLSFFFVAVTRYLENLNGVVPLDSL